MCLLMNHDYNATRDNNMKTLYGIRGSILTFCNIQLNNCIPNLPCRVILKVYSFVQG